MIKKNDECNDNQNDFKKMKKYFDLAQSVAAILS